jgi:hypothetical protein
MCIDELDLRGHQIMDYPIDVMIIIPELDPSIPHDDLGFEFGCHYYPPTFEQILDFHGDFSRRNNSAQSVGRYGR